MLRIFLLLLTTLTWKVTAQTEPVLPMVIPIVVVDYFPLDGDHIDRRITGDVGESYTVIREKCARMTRETIHALEEGSRYHGYKNTNALPSIQYQVIVHLEFREPLPTCPLLAGEQAPMTDYNAIMKKIDARKYVEEQGAKEIWIWGYHGGKVDLWESNMSSPYGDVSNSSCNPKDLPIFKNTYTVYHYNYQRDVGEAVEDHTHQIEALLNHVDGRDRTPSEKWPDLLFWGKFVGSDKSHKIVTQPARCGWTHYPPNGEKDYDWSNKRYVDSDIEDWNPDKPGPTQRINCDKWGGDGLRWKIYWMQNIPGANSGLTYQGKPLANWWIFKADWDRAQREKLRLVSPDR